MTENAKGTKNAKVIKKEKWYINGSFWVEKIFSHLEPKKTFLGNIGPKIFFSHFRAKKFVESFWAKKKIFSHFGPKIFLGSF